MAASGWPRAGPGETASTASERTMHLNVQASRCALPKDTLNSIRELAGGNSRCVTIEASV